MSLTDTKLRHLRSKPLPGKYGDRDGLFIRVTAAGGMYWQWRIRTPRGETTVSYGKYPEVTLAEAREKHMATRKQVREGVNPNDAKRQAKLKRDHAAATTFEAVAREWYDVKRGEWADSYGAKIMRRFEVDVFPHMGDMPIAEIDPPTLLSVLRRIERRGAIETAHRAMENCGQVFRYGVATGRVLSDPSRDLRGALRKPVVKHMAAIVNPDELAGLLRAIDGYAGTHIVRTALQLAPMLMLRPGELRFAQWPEFDLDAATWAIPPERMKRQKAGKMHGDPHIVPLPRQAVALLRDLHPLTGPGGYVFRGERDHERAMSENTVNAALRRMGFDTQKDMTGHGFRATARTILDERLGFDRAVIEAQLAHTVSDSLGRAYNRTEFLDQRRTMLQAWADYLDRLREKPASPAPDHAGQQAGPK
ncbi:tyrosine-type recombinase/integrase [Ottowia sp. SB7-C50]|uniref:tyrosine-type recombinase/integrase n=1 Tax=Ottowia sp. SB7-C50 TaxID=3081231 RepID=UPI002954199B|nr:integrase arm-type DNA-binding domain-containing protein [Ottowia sp. SB7-C50]WOP15940.1 integrase arm-type DNA-binding domain-containing protein [Ottowia sp. SB7-C50]